MFATIGYYICIPFAWLLRTLYNLTGSYGLALIFFTLVVKVVLLPFQIKSKKSMMRMTRFQPKIKEIQTRYANNREKMNEELQRLYAEEKINPMGGCLWSMLPFPILIALYSIIRQPMSRFMMLPTETIEAIRAAATKIGYVAAMQGKNVSFYEEIGLAKFVTENFDQFQNFVEEGLMAVNYNFIGLDLTVIPTSAIGEIFTGGWAALGVVLIPVISAAISFFQSKVSMASQPSGDDAAARSGRMMFWMMPVMSLYIGFTLPAALGVYWIANSVFMIAQDVPMNKYFKKAMEKEELLRAEERKNDRVRRMEEAKKIQFQSTEEKVSLKEKQKAAASAKAAKAAKAASATTEAGRVGERPYARGRAFNPEHYGE